MALCRPSLTSGLVCLCLGMTLLKAVPAWARDIIVGTEPEFNTAVTQLTPGDVLILKNGVWNNFEILFEGQGTAAKPILLRPETKGGVILSGQSNLRLAGEYLEVSGLVFKDGFTPTGAVISFRRDKDHLANHSRVTEVVIDSFNNPDRFEADYWIAIYGKHNRFDHNHISGKKNKGVTLAVRLDGAESRDNKHRIDHNYFGPRQPLGSNGGETLRVGTSHHSLTNSATTIDHNFFDRCSGEVEIVSIKSAGNVVRDNVFADSKGTLTLRHGRGNVIERNVFLGNGVDHTGGIRVINQDQVIRHNYMEGLKGYRFGGAFVVMNGVPNSPINRYHQVDNAVIEGNSIIESDHIELAAGSDQERSAVPVNSYFTRNLIAHSSIDGIFGLYDDISGIKFTDNVLIGNLKPPVDNGFTFADSTLARSNNGLLYPVDATLQNRGVPKDLNPIAKSTTGVSWYEKPDKPVDFGSAEILEVDITAGALFAALSQVSDGGTLKLAPGTHRVSKILPVNKRLLIIADADAVIEFERSTLFEIQEGGGLHLRGVTITGAYAPDYKGNSVIRTAAQGMLSNFEVSIEDTVIRDLTVNKFFNVIIVSKGTMADRIDISGSTFQDISGSVLKLDQETDDFGIYNAEYVDISSSVFERINGPVVDVYRGGTDESTFGPHFKLTNSLISEVGAANNSGASVVLHGVQVADIHNNRFVGSASIRVNHTVAEPKTSIFNNSFKATGAPVIVELNSALPQTALVFDNTFHN